MSDLDYCSSDWDFESDDELDAEDIKKESFIGYFLISFTIIFMSFLIVAYLQSFSIPLCIWTGFEMLYSKDSPTTTRPRKSAIKPLEVSIPRLGHPMHPKHNASSEYSHECETTHKLDERDEANCLRKS